MSYDIASRTLWLSGGEGLGSPGHGAGLLNDIWSFDGVDWTWRAGNMVPNQHSAFGQPAACSVSDPNALWGPAGQPCTTTDISDGGAQCAATNGCTFTPATTTVPGGRKGHVMWIDRTQPACENIAGWVSYILDSNGNPTGSNTCVNFELGEAAGVCASYGHLTNSNGIPAAQACCVCGGGYTPISETKIVLFGGMGFAHIGSSGFLADMWAFDGTQFSFQAAPGSRGVTAINVPGTYGTVGHASGSIWPSARFQTSAWADGQGRIWLFGGYGHPSENSDISAFRGTLNDLWSYANLCTSGVSISNSPTSCTGYVTSEVCDFICKMGTRLDIIHANPPEEWLVVIALCLHVLRQNNSRARGSFWLSWRNNWRLVHACLCVGLPMAEV